MTSNVSTTNMKKHKCKVCDKSFDTERQLHAHLKAHKMRMAEYYQTYYPRHDKHDGKIIKFKSKDYYFENDFNSRTNLRLWLKNQEKEVFSGLFWVGKKALDFGLVDGIGSINTILTNKFGLEHIHPF